MFRKSLAKYHYMLISVILFIMTDLSFNFVQQKQKSRFPERKGIYYVFNKVK